VEDIIDEAKGIKAQQNKKEGKGGEVTGRKAARSMYGIDNE
jgi:hypothetical protein